MNRPTATSHDQHPMTSAPEMMASFPLGGIDEGGRFEFATGNSSVREVIWCLLATRPGERLHAPQFGVGQRIAVGRSSALRWGFATSPFTLGGGLELGIKRGRLIYSANYHPVLGLTQMLSLSYGSAMTRPEGNDGLR